ncbi:fumarylacetoacetate hydrolase family protein [Streptosporangium longisporum]|uniref:fumarylacetoacetate hydrolase family protein n=1 Tax=Streptosporangium longisporum TaxID=46187 RepID=UPI003CD052A2
MKTDYEVEQAVVPRRHGPLPVLPQEAAGVIRRIRESPTTSTDGVPERRGGQWDKGKSCRRSTRWAVVVTPGRGGRIRRRSACALWVNGPVRQTQHQETDLVSSCRSGTSASSMVLEPGDVVNTGTPAGVALGMAPGGVPARGDVVDVRESTAWAAKPADGNQSLRTHGTLPGWHTRGASRPATTARPP